MENQTQQQPQTQEKPKKPVWKKWWFWVIILVIGGIMFSNHTSKVNYCKKECEYHITDQGEGIWLHIYVLDKVGDRTGYSTREECIEDCLLTTNWETIEY